MQMNELKRSNTIRQTIVNNDRNNKVILKLVAIASCIIVGTY